MRRQCAGEAIGTFGLVLIGTGAVMLNARTDGALGTVGIALAFGGVVLGLVAALGHVSGAHINPAVTVAFWWVGRFPTRSVVPYIAAQLLGAVAASGVLRAVLGNVASLGATFPTVSTGGALAVEFLLSFALMFVIMSVATAERAAWIAPAAIGATVGLCALVGGPLTGASMNPARSFGPALVGGRWQSHWLYWVAPVAGMIAAAQLHEMLRPVRAAGVEPEALGVEGPIAR